MIDCLNQLEISISYRFDHISILTTDSTNLSFIVKDEDKRRVLVRNFRNIKAQYKLRIVEYQKCLAKMEKFVYQLNKCYVIASENMLVNCINQYLNSEYYVRKTGYTYDLIDIFMFYYEKINAQSKVCQMKVIKNCGLFYYVGHFLKDNLAILLQHVQKSMEYVYEHYKSHFFTTMKSYNRQPSPERRPVYYDYYKLEKFDTTGHSETKKKRKLQQYCFNLSQLLDLYHIYLNYFYFSSLDLEKRAKVLYSNFSKRNLHIRRVMYDYHRYYISFSGKDSLSNI